MKRARRATWVGRSGLYSSTDATHAPESFQLSEKMLAALAEARDETSRFQSEIANSGEDGGGGNRTRVSVHPESPHLEGDSGGRAE